MRGIVGMREERDADEALDLVSDLSEEGRFTKVVERGRGPAPAADLVGVTGGEALAGMWGGAADDRADVDTVCKIPAVLARCAGLETTAKDEGGCRSRMGVGTIRSLVRSDSETRSGGEVLGLLVFSRSKSREVTRRMAFMRSSSESDGLLTLGVAVTSLLILRWCAVDGCCCLFDATGPCPLVEELLGELGTKLFGNLRVGGGVNGSSLSTSRSLPLSEFSCLNKGVSTGGFPTSVLMSIRGLGCMREDLFVETDAELPGLFGGTNADNGKSESLSDELDDVSESSFFCGCCFRGTCLGTEAVRGLRATKGGKNDKSWSSKERWTLTRQGACGVCTRQDGPTLSCSIRGQCTCGSRSPGSWRIRCIGRVPFQRISPWLPCKLRFGWGLTRTVTYLGLCTCSGATACDGTLMIKFLGRFTITVGIFVVFVFG